MTLATPEYLSHLRSLFPANSSIQNPYAYVIGIVFAANNKPPETVAVYQHAIADTDDPAGVTRKFREALFKTAVLYGAPRMINALLEVEKVSTVPAESPYRDPVLPVQEMTARGEKLFAETYGENAKSTRELLRGVHPDFDYYMMTLVYGPIYAFSEILPDVETSFAMIAALIAIEAPLQVRWHVDGALRHGATQEEIDAVREIAESVLARIKG